MADIRVVATIDKSVLPEGSYQGYDTGWSGAEVRVETSGTDTNLILTNTTGDAYQINLTGGAVEMGDVTALDASAPSQVVTLGFEGAMLGIDTADMEEMLRVADASGQALQMEFDGAAYHGEVYMTAVAGETGDTRTVFVSAQGGTDIGVYEYDGQTLTHTGAIEYEDGAGFVQAMSAWEDAGETYLAAGDVLDAGLTTYSVNADGSAEALQTIGYDEQLAHSAGSMATVNEDDRTLMVLGSMQFGGISVVEFSDEGDMTVLDHVISASSGGGFGNASFLDVKQIGEQTFIVAGDANGSVSLMSLTPDGRVVVRDTYHGGEQGELLNIAEMTVVENDGNFDIFLVSSGQDAVVTQLRVDIGDATTPRLVTADYTGGAGDDIIQASRAVNTDMFLDGGAGDDVIFDGLGQDVLRGGVGADVFVFGKDGVTDVIEDFDVNEDRLDLSGWQINNFTQVQVTSTSDGARLFVDAEIDGYGRVVRDAEELIIKSADGQSISADAFGWEDVAPLRRTDLEEQREMQAAWANRVVLEADAAGDVLYGSDGDDNLLGGSGDDVFYFSAGLDMIWGGGGRDRIDFSGADTGITLNLASEYANDGAALWTFTADIEDAVGTNFDDLFRANDAGSTFWGGAGNDTFIGGAGEDIFVGGAGADQFQGGEGFQMADYSESGVGLNISMTTDKVGTGDAAGDTFDTKMNGVSGTNFDDMIWGGTTDNSLYGADGNDEIFGGPSSSTRSNDQLFGGAGDDVLHGQKGNDILRGEDGDDVLYGGEGSDWLFGGEGDNLMISDGGNINRYVSGSGNDEVRDGAGHSIINTGAGNDRISAGEGADKIFGGDGNDSIDGGVGQDTIVGGAGDDELTGGAGADVFVFRAGMDEDVITDFAGDQLLFTEELLGFNFEAGSAPDDMLAILAEFAFITDDGVKFDFGNGNTLLLDGLEGYGDLHQFIMVTEH